MTQNAAIKLETPRMILREMTEDDYPALADILRDDQTMRSYGGALSEEEARRWMGKQLARYRDDGLGLWAAILKEGGGMMGQIGITWQDVDGERLPEIGYLLNRAHWSRGYATEAASACKRYAFEELGMEEVYSIVRDTNITSINVAIRAGMLVRKLTVRHFRGTDMPHYVLSARRGERGRL
jgi:RimJ/RimL family protein N-acetyltransferase